MKTIQNLSLDECTEIATIAQSQDQFENYSVTLYELDGKNYIRENLLNDSNYYEIEEGDDVSAPLEFVKQVASDWAGNADETDLELMRWHLRDVSDFKVADDYDGNCKIVVEGGFYEFSPIDYAAENYETLIFDTKELAQEWIDSAESGVYYTSHNEAGRPTYTIAAA
jgi:hypothetical protein